MDNAEGKRWCLYILRCKSGQLYTGISTDVARRLTEHEAGKGAKYLRGKTPLKLLYQQCIGSHSDALKAEIKMKKLSKQAKEALVAQSTQAILNNPG